MTVTRKIEIHPERRDVADCISVDCGGIAGWLTIDVTPDESVTVFLNEKQMRALGERLTTVADVRARHYQDVAQEQTIHG